jgi:transposase
MLAELVDHVIGVDSDRDWITVAVLDSRTAGVITTDGFPATRDGYQDAIAWADAHTEESERAWVIEGTASYGRGLTMALQHLDELVIEFDRPMRKATKDGAKSDALDAIRAAREALGRDKLNQHAPTTESEKPSGFTQSREQRRSGLALLQSTS